MVTRLTKFHFERRLLYEIVIIVPIITPRKRKLFSSRSLFLSDKVSQPFKSVSYDDNFETLIARVEIAFIFRSKISPSSIYRVPIYRLNV